MHDIKFIESNSDYVKENLGKRKFDISVIDEAIALNKSRKSLTTSVEKNQSEIKSISKEVGQKKKNGEDATVSVSYTHLTLPTTPYV